MIWASCAQVGLAGPRLWPDHKRKSGFRLFAELRHRQSQTANERPSGPPTCRLLGPAIPECRRCAVRTTVRTSGRPSRRRRRSQGRCGWFGSIGNWRCPDTARPSGRSDDRWLWHGRRFSAVTQDLARCAEGWLQCVRSVAKSGRPATVRLEELIGHCYRQRGLSRVPGREHEAGKGFFGRRGPTQSLKRSEPGLRWRQTRAEREQGRR